MLWILGSLFLVLIAILRLTVEYSRILAATGESVVGGHSVLIVGYDDSKVSKNPRDGNTKTGCFLIRNSWSESWGDHGYGWMPYAYFMPGANGDVYADDVWTITEQEWVNTGEFSWK